MSKIYYQRSERIIARLMENFLQRLDQFAFFYPFIPEERKLLMKVRCVARKNAIIGAQTKRVAAIRRLQSEPLSCWTNIPSPMVSVLTRSTSVMIRGQK